MNAKEESAYVQGSNAAWRLILQEALKQLGTDSPEWTAQRWQVERAAVVAMLRTVCRDHGDNEWPDDLHLADVIEKHLCQDERMRCIRCVQSSIPPSDPLYVRLINQINSGQEPLTFGEQFEDR